LYQAKKNNGDMIIYLFRTANRKRRSQLEKACKRYLPSTQSYLTEAVTKSEMKKKIEEIKSNDQFYSFTSYTASQKYFKHGPVLIAKNDILNLSSSLLEKYPEIFMDLEISQKHLKLDLRQKLILV